MQIIQYYNNNYHPDEVTSTVDALSLSSHLLASSCKKFKGFP